MPPVIAPGVVGAAVTVPLAVTAALQQLPFNALTHTLYVPAVVAVVKLAAELVCSVPVAELTQ